VVKNTLKALLLASPLWFGASLSLFLPYDGIVEVLSILNLPGFVLLTFPGFYNVHNVPDVLVWLLSCTFYFVIFMILLLLLAAHKKQMTKSNA